MDERRRYFRIDDDFHVRLFPAGMRTASNVVGDEAKELHAALVRLGNKLPEVAELFRLLDRRLAKLENGGMDGPGSPTALAHGTNISGSGVAFHSRQRLVPGVDVDLDLVLDEGKLELQASGRIVSCDLVSNEFGGGHGDGCLVRVEFTEIAARDEETLIQYVLQRQVRRLRVERSLGRAVIQPGAR